MEGNEEKSWDKWDDMRVQTGKDKDKDRDVL